MITVFIAGASGKMGRQVSQMLEQSPNFEVVGGLDHTAHQTDHFPIFHQLAEINLKADVWLDFTVPSAAPDNAEFALKHGFNTIIGTSGLSADTITSLSQVAQVNQQKLLIVPNFSITAVLMMQFAAKAAEYMPDAEIVEIHHSDKVDSPSGTALATAQAINNARRQQATTPFESNQPARGQLVNEVPVHALRLPGYVAQEEVIFGAPGESLTISQVSYDRSSFMAGIRLALTKVNDLPNALTIGLDSLLSN